MDNSDGGEYKKPEKKSEYKDNLHILSNNCLLEKLQEQGKYLIQK
jgi:hypothetical protein